MASQLNRRLVALSVALAAAACSSDDSGTVDNSLLGTAGVFGGAGVGGTDPAASGGTAGVGAQGAAGTLAGPGIVGSAGTGAFTAGVGAAGVDAATAGVLGSAGVEGAMAGVGAAGAAGSGVVPDAGCLADIGNYGTKGPFTVTTATSGLTKIWVPAVPAGCKVPVVHLANGTGASCATYGSILSHLASHGFLAGCYENTNTGQGTQCITALEAMYAKYPDLADDKIGSTGHSQGGGAAFMCVYRAEEKWGATKLIAGHSMEPASGYGDSPADWAMYYAKIESPMFMFNGSADTLVNSAWVGRAFDAMPETTEAYWYEATGAAHIPVPTRWTQESAVAWFRWKLLGDSAACEHIKNMPAGNDWNEQKKQNEVPCN